MPTETQIRTGQCPTHGTVEATREIPPLHFPYMVFAVRRAVAKRRPFRCPSCGSTVETN
jgi:hypothetical protein